jgi:SAM-dependent methyltransferase
MEKSKLKFKQCPLCNNPNLENMFPKEMMYGTRVEYTYSKCNKCVILFFNDNVDEDNDQYKDNYYSFRVNNTSIFERIRLSIYHLSVKGSLGKFLFLNAFFERLIDENSAKAISGIIENSKKVLDIGCGSGELLRSLSKIYPDKNFLGIDPFLTSDIVYSDSCKIYKKDIFSFNESNFDLIMLNHSFEHMESPLDILQQIYDRLAQNGIIVLRIPVCDSYLFNHFKEDWVQLDAPRHKYIFSNNSINFLLEKIGFNLVFNFSDSRPFSFIASKGYSKNLSIRENPYFKGRIRNFFNIYYQIAVLKARNQAKKINALNYGDQRVYYFIKK